MKKYIVERRRVDEDQDGEPSPWERVGGGDTLQEAAWAYNRWAMYLRCHEQRLLDPDGNLVLHHQDRHASGLADLSPLPWRERWRDLLLFE